MAAPLQTNEERLLVLAPTGRDGRLVLEMLAGANIQAELCESIDGLCAQAVVGAGALFIAEEALTTEGIAALQKMVEQQPPWSDIPVIISTGQGATTLARVRSLDSIGASGNVIILERPVRILTMVVTIQGALRARRRQYQMRNLTRQIVHERNKLETLIKQVPVGICIVEGPELCFTIANGRYLDISRKKEHELIGKPIAEVFPEVVQAGRHAMLLEVYRTGAPCDVPEFSRRVPEKDGSSRVRYYESAYRALRDPGGEITGVMVVTLDTTDQVAARQALESSRVEAIKARAAAEAANRTKDEFLAMLGHELRNPLAPILTALQLMRLREGADTKERAIIERQARHMAALVDDLLDVSRITQSKIELKREVLELGELLSKAIETAGPMLEKRHHDLNVQVPARTHYVDGDPDRLIQVFSNILTNAAKYTEEGGSISIVASAEDGQVAVRIRDTGRGISPQMLPHIFELFSQEHQNLDRAQGGLGLGLAIVKSLVEMHGGRVSVTSDGNGKGSEFSVLLPAAQAPKLALHEPASDLPPAPAQARRGPLRLPILVVDDNKDAAEMLAEAFEMLGYEPRVAFDGPQALALARASGPPAAAFLDIGLPVMDGYELARRLRELPGWSELPLVAVTGYGQERDRRQSLDAGFNQHLVKPIGLAALKRALESLAS
jgi:PAS domain S-box-containing protein